GAVVFPTILIPMAVTEAPMVDLLRTAVAGDKRVAMVTDQPGKDPSTAYPGNTHFFSVCISGLLLQPDKMPDKTMRLLVQGKERFRITEYSREGEAWYATGEILETVPEEGIRVQALHRIVLAQFQEIVALSPHVSEEMKELLNQLND